MDIEIQRSIQPLKVQLLLKEISPEGALMNLREIAASDEQPIRLCSAIEDELNALSEAVPPRDSATAELRTALRQESEDDRRYAVGIVLDRIMASPAVREYRQNYRAAQPFLEQLKAHGLQWPGLSADVVSPANEAQGRNSPARSIDRASRIVGAAPSITGAVREETPAGPILHSKEDRRRAVHDHQAEWKRATGKKRTYRQIAQAANRAWNDRTPIAKWIEGTEWYSSATVNEMIRAALTQKPPTP